MPRCISLPTVLIVVAGKTIQVAALIAALLGKTGIRRHDEITPAKRAEAAALLAKLGPGAPGESPISRVTLAALPILILAPNGLLENWRRELAAWTYTEVRVLTATQSAAERQALIDVRQQHLSHGLLYLFLN
jgi:hypothetical protein